MPRLPAARVTLDIFHRGTFLGQAVAGGFRADLVAHGIGDGRHAFLFHLPDDVPADVAAADLAVTSSGPVRLALPFSSAFSRPAPRARKLGAKPRDVFEPWVCALSVPTPTCPPHEGRRPRIEALLVEDRDVGASAFIVHMARKYARPVGRTEWRETMRWYLETYATERGPAIAPLSRADIQRLEVEEAPAVSVGMSLAAAEIEGDAHPVFAWAQASHRRFVEDCLVTAEQAETLRAVALRDADLPFPLSAFMAEARERFVVLRRFRADRERDRQAVYALLALMALRRPAIASYIPTAWLRRLLAPRVLEPVVARLFRGNVEAACRNVRDRLAAALADVNGEQPRPHEYRGHRIRGGSSIVAGPPEVDVQIIGPFRRRMGLGETCRRVARALARTRYSLNMVDYTVGSASRTIDIDMPLGPVRPARLNVLQLNLEEVPEALAYLPDVFATTPTVVIPFWELNRPSAVHRLGLSVVDEIWAASHFLETVFEQAGPPVRWIGMSCEETAPPSASRRTELRRRYGLAPSTFTYLTTSDALSWVQRKNPLGVIRAFRAAFDAAQDVALIVKTHNLSGPLSKTQDAYWREIRTLCADDPRIVFIDESFDAETQRTLLAAVDCFVSLHRAEGLGLDPLDALWLGTPVVATAYSGVTDFCTAETAWMVEAGRVEVDALDYNFVEPGHVWACPSHDSAVACLRGVYENAPLRERRSEAGRRFLTQMATCEAFSQRLETRIEQWLPSASQSSPPT